MVCSLDEVTLMQLYRVFSLILESNASSIYLNKIIEMELEKSVRIRATQYGQLERKHFLFTLLPRFCAQLDLVLK